MHIDPGNPSPALVHPRLQSALALLEQGEPAEARKLAQDVLSEAELRDDRTLEVQALLGLAYTDRASGRFRRAYDTAQHVIKLFRLQGSLAGEVESLSLLAHCASHLGHDEEAVESALLGVRLGEALSPGLHRVNGLNSLGGAYLWCKTFSMAEAAFTEALALAGSFGPGCAWLSGLGLAWTEVVRLAKTRYFTGELPTADELLRRAIRCHELLAVEPSAPLLPGTLRTFGPIVRMTHALALCWSGEPAKALAELRRDTPTAVPSSAHVADAIERWVWAEISWQQGDLGAAQAHARKAIALADQVEYEQLACLGHLVLAQLHELQGHVDLAMAELRSLRQRETRLRAERVESRHRVVQTALDMRSHERSLEQLSRYSKELERLSFEDALTGLSNRRRFEGQLETLLETVGTGAPPVCVALIDLDDFKRVNTAHTHAGGDEVLCGVADALRCSVRERDLPARLAGDEFVVLLPHTSLVEARGVCARVQEAVAALRWPHLDPTLQVSVTVGLAEAFTGDTPASVLHRSDVAMFARK